MGHRALHRPEDGISPDRNEQNKTPSATALVSMAVSRLIVVNAELTDDEDRAASAGNWKMPLTALLVVRSSVCSAMPS